MNTQTTNQTERGIFQTAQNTHTLTSEQIQQIREEMGETTIDQNPTQTVEPQATAQTGLTSEQIQQMREELGAEPTSDPYETRPTQQTPKRTTTKKADDTQTQPTTQIPPITLPSLPSIPTLPQLPNYSIFPKEIYRNSSKKEEEISKILPYIIDNNNFKNKIYGELYQEKNKIYFNRSKLEDILDNL